MKKEYLIRLVLGSVLCLLPGAFIFAQADIYEPDDNCFVQATVISGGDLQNHDFEDDTEDWFAFNACVGRAFNIDATPLGPSADVRVELYGRDCTTLLATDYGGLGIPASISGWTAPEDGTFHIKVLQEDATTGPGREYDITLMGDTSGCLFWAKQYSRAGTLFQVSDGSFFLISLRYIAPGDNDVLLSKINSSGGFDWTRSYPGPGDEMDVSMDETGSGEFIVSATSEDATDEPSIWVFSIDSGGNFIWGTRYGRDLGVNGESRSGQVIALSNGGILVAGTSLRDGDKVFLMKLSSVGALIWTKLYGDEPGYGYTLDETGDGNFVIGAVHPEFPDQQWIIKVDPDGTPLWNKTLWLDTTYKPGIVRGTPDGGAIVLWGHGDFVLVRLGPTGSIVWQKLYQTERLERAYGLEHIGNNAYLLSGATLESPQGCWALVVDLSGAIQWQGAFRYVTHPMAAIYHAIPLVDGGFIVSEMGSGMIQKVDANGEYGYCCSMAAPFEGSVVTSAVNMGDYLISLDSSVWGAASSTAGSEWSYTLTETSRCPSPDSDGDGVLDDCDQCPGFDDALDGDGDSIPDDCDACPGFDDLLDADGDTVPDGCDACPGFDDLLDFDSDTVPDNCDNCLSVSNPVQTDTDGDGVGDVCEGLLGQVPDGLIYPGSQMKAALANGGSDLAVTWDALSCPTADVNFFWGDMAVLSSYSLAGTTCRLGGTGFATVALPPGNSFFFLAASDGQSNESLHGFDSDGFTVPVSGAGSCGILNQTIATNCTAPETAVYCIRYVSPDALCQPVNDMHFKLERAGTDATVTLFTDAAGTLEEAGCASSYSVLPVLTGTINPVTGDFSVSGSDDALSQEWSCGADVTPVVMLGNIYSLTGTFDNLFDDACGCSSQSTWDTNLTGTYWCTFAASGCS